ncbi:GGDEF domain-containing protein [Pseudoalteromonas shioyasakiensis]|uniref:GGDEF domain-containing protein n=1 Tax=Pseudoalteromonas shioyasakiensis TaxID=1190813 RepID=UPI00211918BB|nr:GGDEF domain-containing protein [Pseudoalteromonas shioyasakiensis]
MITGYLLAYNQYDTEIHPNGVFSDGINLSIVIILFSMVQCSQLAKKTYFYLSLGLWCWSTGLVFDLLDEIFFQPRWIGIYAEDLFRTSGMLITGYGLYLALQNLSQAHHQLSKDLVTDDLTQVANRRYFYQWARENYAQNYSVFIIDIDHFKLINDDFGHDEGDRVLKEFAAKFEQAFSTEGVFARIGGEEFAVFYPTTEHYEINKVASELLVLANTVLVAKTRNLSVSIGIATKDDSDNLDQIMKRADQALYKAKNGGRNRYEIV